MAADTSLAYAINNHPVIRGRIAQAIVGILWYLGLLVPFVFFFEKLVFGFADVRKQLLEKLASDRTARLGAMTDPSTSGRRPVSSSYSTAPSTNTSVAVVTGSPARCSGAE